jgi:hypothetical protein
MNKKQAFSLALASITLGLTACGGTDGVPATATGSGTTTTAPITPAAVACTAPTDDEFNTGFIYASACIPNASGGGSARYDLRNSFRSASAADFMKVDFSNATCTSPSSGSTEFIAGAYANSGTATVASLGVDGVTPVTGEGRSVTVYRVDGSTSGFAASTPFTSTGTYVVCKTTLPNTTAARTVDNFRGGGQITFTPTFVLRASPVGTNTIETRFGFDGAANSF